MRYKEAVQSHRLLTNAGFLEGRGFVYVEVANSWPVITGIGWGILNAQPVTEKPRSVKTKG